MKKEIKEILDNFEKYEARYKLHNETQFIITHREIQILYDYITNLQQENDDLKNRLENAVADCNLRLQENERLKELCDEYEEEHSNEFKIWKEERHELLDYKSRYDKAIEYIMTELIDEWSIKNQGYVSGSDLPVEAITPLLDILQNGGEE